MGERIELNSCGLCPRNCAVNRQDGGRGYCGETMTLRAARAALHYWEEPCISGETGSGAIFFSGCSMRCVFCQNHDIARSETGREITVERLTEICLELEAKGANNINLITAGHFLPQVIRGVEGAKNRGLSIPVVYNTSSYESLDSIRALDGLVDIYLPDFKYFDSTLSGKYSKAKDYPEVAMRNIEEMVRQRGELIFEEELMKQGIIVRHLVLPGQIEDSKNIIRYLYETYGDQIYLSIMNQYTPLPWVEAYPELNRKVTEEEYEEVLDFAIDLGVENAFIQEGDVAEESFIPEFSYEGL